MKTSNFRMLWLALLFVLSFQSPSFSMLDGNEYQGERREDEEKHPSKKIKLKGPIEEDTHSDKEESKTPYLENYSHSHWPQTKTLRTLYVSENASIIYGNHSIPFFCSLDETLSKHARNVSKDGGNNWLFLSIHLGTQNSEGALQWKSSPFYYDEQTTRYSFSFESNIAAQVTPDNLKLGTFRVPTWEENTTTESYHYVGKRTLNKKLAEPESYLTTYHGGFHTEIQALSLLLDEWDMLFDSKLRAYNPSIVIIKMHSYNDVCGGCQSYILTHQPIFQNIIKDYFSTEIESKQIPIVFLGVANKPYGMNEYYRTADEPCECSKPYSNWSYLRQKKEGAENREILKAYLIQSGIYTAVIDPYVDVCELGSLGSNFKPYDGQVDLFKNLQGKQPHLLTLIKMPNLSNLNINLPENLAYLASCYGLK